MVSSLLPELCDNAGREEDEDELPSSEQVSMVKFIVGSSGTASMRTTSASRGFIAHLQLDKIQEGRRGSSIHSVSHLIASGFIVSSLVDKAVVGTSPR